MFPLLSLVMPFASQVLNALGGFGNTRMPPANPANTHTKNIDHSPTNIYINNKISF